MSVLDPHIPQIKTLIDQDLRNYNVFAKIEQLVIKKAPNQDRIKG